MKRIAILTLGTPSDQVAGGIERFTYLLKKLIEDEDTEVNVFHRGVLPSPKAPAVYKRLGLGEVYTTYKISRLFAKECQNSEEYDLVISNQEAGWPIRGRKAINVFHVTLAQISKVLGSTLPFHNFLQMRYIQSQFERLSGAGKKIVTVSRRVANEVEELYHLPVSEVIHNGVDVDHFRPYDTSEFKESLGLPEDTFLGLFVGRHKYLKGIDILKEISRKLPDDVTIATLGGENGGDISEKIKCVAPIPYDELPFVYSGADFFLFPSRYEGCALAPLEAMACELPVIISNSGVTEEVLMKNKILGRFVVNTFDPDDYVEKILELKSSPSTLRQVKRESRRVAHDLFSLSKFGERYRKLVFSLV